MMTDRDDLSGLPTVLHDHCAICAEKLGFDRSSGLKLWRGHFSDEAEPICEDCWMEHDCEEGGVIYADAYEPADVGAA